MLPVRHPGRRLKRAGNLLLAAGVILLFVGFTKFLQSWYATNRDQLFQPKSAARAGVVVPPIVTLTEAKQIIPDVLRKIYSALDEGRPRDVAAFLDGAFFTQPRSLDNLCQPFNYRAHYIAAVIEGVGNQKGADRVFRARVHTLYKSVGEMVNLMHFAPMREGEQVRLYLRWFEGDPLTIERAIAKDTVRTFIYAARAEQWDKAAQLASIHFELDQLKLPEWRALLSKVKGVEVHPEKTISDHGVKVQVSVKFDPFSYTTFIVDPFSAGKIVHISYTHFISGKKLIVRDPEIERSTLSRFGLLEPAASKPADEQNSKQPAKPPEEVDTTKEI